MSLLSATMASSALYGVLFLHSKLYGAAGLQLVFIMLVLELKHDFCTSSSRSFILPFSCSVSCLVVSSADMNL
jgi:membrane-bound metal-dependent hydrolase YbcI (DUF457 family)